MLTVVICQWEIETYHVGTFLSPMKWSLSWHPHGRTEAYGWVGFDSYEITRKMSDSGSRYSCEKVLHTLLFHPWVFINFLLAR